MENETSFPGSPGEHRLQEKYGTEKRAAAFYGRQMLDHLSPTMRRFIEQQEMVFIATSDARGECDCSFRAGLPGFVVVLNEKTLLYPEYRGNGVLASLGNLSENPHVGMMFIDFIESTIGLHVNGTARIIERDEILQHPDLPDGVRREITVEGGRRAERWVEVKVEEAYIHCAKHIPRFAKRDKKIDWGTDDEQSKGGDYFGVTAK
ncbi:MAG: pyridoxamine 5'-phosphate oxidase family protein [Candidatus Manganitrophaceae bacterium]